MNTINRFNNSSIGLIFLGLFALLAIYLKESNLASVAVGVIGGYISHQSTTTSGT